jgi:hypothetical protein
MKIYGQVFCDRIKVKKKSKLFFDEERKLKMNSEKILKTVSKQIAALLVVLLIAFLASPTVWAAEQLGSKNTIVTGSGEKFRTTVTRQTKGQISSEDLRQVSLLASQVLMHVNKAEQSIELGNSDSVKAEIKDAKNLIDIAHKLLPVNLVTTTVKDAKDAEVYKNTEAAQDDIVPLYRKVAGVDVFDDIINARKEQLQGREFLGRVNLSVTMLADLGYIERKVQHAMQLIDNNQSDEARQQLLLAQSYGVNVRFSETESPLVDTQKAFSLAEQMVHEKKYDAAIGNLILARIKLQEYAELAGKPKADKAKQLTMEIGKLVGKIKEKGSAGKIHALWHKTTSLLQRHPSQAKPTVQKTTKG